MKKIIVTESNVRLDKYTSENTDYSRNIINKMVEQECIFVNGKIAKSSTRLKENDEITITKEYALETNMEPVKMDINIVYEDDDIIIVNKPSGLVVHPGSGNHNNTLANGLMYHTKHLSDIEIERPGIVHRIDKDTSGLLVVAKNNKAHNILVEDFKNKNIHREYIALIVGEFPHKNALIDAPIGRDIKNRQKMDVTANNSKTAVTHLTVLKRFKDYTLVKLVLETGRTHQIRVHMKYIGYPVYNDPVYSKKSEGDFGQFLHSSSLDLIQPITKEPLHFDVPLPDFFEEFLKTLEELRPSDTKNSNLKK